MGNDLPDVLRATASLRELLATGGAELLAALRTLAGLVAASRHDVDHVAVWIFDSRDGPLRCVVRHDRATGQQEQDLTMPIDDAPGFLRAVTTSRLIVLDDAVSDPRTRELAERWTRPRGVGSAIVAPCRCTGHVVALLVFAREAPPRPFGPELQDAAARVADIVGTLVRAASSVREHSPEDRLLESISRERRLLEQVLHQLPSGVLLTDPSGRVLLQNAESERIIGTRIPPDPADWSWERAGLTIPLDDSPLFRALRRGEHSIRQEVAAARADGREMWLSVNSGPVRGDDGELVAAVAAFEDITERRRTALALEEEGRLRERFMAILGHDLRTPAAAVLMSAQLLQRTGTLDAYQQNLVQRIVSSGQRMERMIRELLDLGMIRAGRIALVRARCDLAAICEEVLDELRSTWPDRTVVVDLDAPAVGVWDADRLAQVISNLVGNALAHGSAEHPVQVTLRSAPESCCVEIRNVGPSIPPELVESLFQPFHGLARRNRHSGLGLGLFISHAIVSAHGGAIALESSGSEVVVRLRLPVDGAASPPPR